MKIPFFIAFIILLPLQVMAQKKGRNGGRDPVVTSVSRSSGSTVGHSELTVKVKNSDTSATLSHGGVDANAVFVDENTITGTTGAQAPGVVDVVVTQKGAKGDILEDGFTYVVEAPTVETTIRFTDVAASAGVAFEHFRDNFAMPLGGGAAIGDFNGDELLDIYVTNSAGANALYRNNGNDTFTDVAAAAGVDDPTGHGNGGGWGDYDNDGDLDLFVANFGTSKLFRNNGNGTFTDVTAVAGVSDPDSTYRTTGVTWGDYDQDADLDLLVVRHFSEHDLHAFQTRDFSDVARPLALYRNNSNGTFVDVTALLGDSNVYPSNVKGTGFKPSFMDYDNDGDVDIYVVNDFGGENYPNVLWRNDGPDGTGGWTFTDVSYGAGADVVIYGMGLAVGDYDNDGDLDFYMTDIGASEFLQNQGDGTFVNITEQTGTGRGTIPGNGSADNSIGWGAAFADLDNDGFLDLYLVAGYLDSDPFLNRENQPNAVFVNNGDGTYADVSDQTGGADDNSFGREVACADFDNDGRIDVFLVNIGKRDGTPGTARLFKNISDKTNNWLIIKTIGTTSNRDGIGARITVTAGGVARIREMGVSEGHQSHSVVPVHFGLGTATQADVIEVRWPSGIVQTLTNKAANQLLSITESGKVTYSDAGHDPSAALPTVFALRAAYPNPFNPSTRIRYELPTRSHIILKIYNLIGEEVASLVDEEKSAGKYEVSWDADGFSSGVYFYRIHAGHFVETKKLVLLR